MPKKGAAITTKKYIKEVMTKVCFAFRVEEIKMSNVIKPPPLKLLTSKLIRALDLAIEKFIFGAERENAVRRLIEHLKWRAPDATFCIDLLSTLHSRGIPCDIFVKDYSY